MHYFVSNTIEASQETMLSTKLGKESLFFRVSIKIFLMNNKTIIQALKNFGSIR